MEFEETKDIIINELKAQNVYGILRECNALIGGGCFISLVEGREINDIDVFFDTLDNANKACNAVIYNCEDYELKYNNTTAMMFRVNNGTWINLIKKRFFSTLQDLFDDFDFTCTMVGLDVYSDLFLVTDACRKAVENKEIVFNHKNNYPLTSLKRVLRYQKRGYTISDGEMDLIGTSIANLKIESGLDFQKHVGKMYEVGNESEQKFSSLTGWMDKYRENNPY